MNLRELLFGWPCNLRYTQRYSTSRCIRPENVAEHTAFVVLYAAAITRWCFAMDRFPRPYINEAIMGNVLEKAVLHDLEECRTGDIHRPFKYSDANLKQNLDHAASLAMFQICERLFPSGPIADQWNHRWEESKDQSFSGRIVQFADFLSVLSYVAQEGADAPQRLNLESMRAHLQKFVKGNEFDFIRELVVEAEQFTKEILGDAA